MAYLLVMGAVVKLSQMFILVYWRISHSDSKCISLNRLTADPLVALDIHWKTNEKMHLVTMFHQKQHCNLMTILNQTAFDFVADIASNLKVFSQ